MPRVSRDMHFAVAKLPSGPSLTAAARIFSNSSAIKLTPKTGRATTSREWQQQLWDFYDTVPEYRSGCDWVGNSISNAKLEVYKDGKLLDNGLTRDIQASLFGGEEGQREALRLLGIHYTVAGESYIIGEPGEREDIEDTWDVVAAVEVQGDSAGTKISVEGEFLEDEALAIRMWKRHPRRRNDANSPSRAILPILGEIVKLTQVVDALADSRLTSAGILWVPSEMDLPSVPVTDGDDETQTFEGADALYRQLIKVASQAIENRGTAAAKVPLVIQAPGEFLEKIQHTEFWSGFDEHVKELREEAIRRIAVGMDMPPEVLTGTADVNHWGAWQIEEAAIKSYIDPLLQLITGALTEGYLTPILKAWGVSEPDTYKFHANTAKMRLRPNRSKEAVELWDRGVLSARSMLVENGFDPEVDAMDDKERREWLLLKVAGGSATPDQVAGALGQLGVAVPSDSDSETRESRPSRSLEDHPDRRPPEIEDSESVVASASPAFVVDGLVLASEQMVYRALERAGNRLKNKIGARTDTDAMDLYLIAPEMSLSECEGLLEDAWGNCARFDYPGVSPLSLQKTLHSYTLTLMRMRSPYDRETLARQLLMETSA